MKRVLYFTGVILFSMTMMFCTKEGPTGPAGADGQNGLDGQNGKDGNANVTTYLFTDSAEIQWAGTNIYFYYDTTFNIPDSILAYGVVLAYYRVKDTGGNLQMWYPAPGLGYNAQYTTRLFIRNDYLHIRAYNPDGSPLSGTVTLPELSAVKVVLIPASTVIMMRTGGDRVDFNDYGATMDYFGMRK